MEAKYNKSKIMRNAWYMLKVKMVKTFADALRKAWRNEKRNMLHALIEGRTFDSFAKERDFTVAADPSFTAGCVAYYASRSGRYVGD